MSEWLEQIKINCDECLIDKTINIDITHGYINMTIKVYKANYGQYLYYYIYCDESTGTHPFMDINIYVNENSIGEVVADNTLTRLMFDYLSMNDEELSKHTGHKHQFYYRLYIINNLVHLWD